MHGRKYKLIDCIIFCQGKEDISRFTTAYYPVESSNKDDKKRIKYIVQKFVQEDLHNIQEKVYCVTTRNY